MGSFYLKQLLVGRDIAPDDGMGRKMQNFVYLVGDRDAGECVIVDAAWDIEGILASAAADDMRVTGALVTHYHPDHIGGELFGLDVEGLADLLTHVAIPVHAHRAEAEGICKVTGLSQTDVVAHDGGDRIRVGNVDIELLHTPGHTPGSLCFRVRDALIAGDTLFLRGCGRVDLPGGDPDEMERTLTQRLGSLPDDLVLYPGHAYGGEHAPMGDVRRTNPYLATETLRRFLGKA